MNAETLIVGLWAVRGFTVWPLFVLPSIIGFRRRHPNGCEILAVNLILGPPGWAIALVWVPYATFRPVAIGMGERLITIDDGGPARGEAVSPPPAVGPLSSADADRKIERLSRMREAGHLSEGEFAWFNARVLAACEAGGLTATRQSQAHPDEVEQNAGGALIAAVEHVEQRPGGLARPGARHLRAKLEGEQLGQADA